MASRFLLRVSILARAARARLTGLRRPPSTTPRRVLIAHHLLFGDTIMLTALLAKLRQQYPHAEVIMATPKATAPLYQKQPYGVKALPFDPRDKRTFKAIARHGPYDLALVPGDNRYSWMALAAGARWIVAFDGDRPAYKSWPVDRLVSYADTPMAWGDMVAGLVDGEEPHPFSPQDWPPPDHAPFAMPSSPYCVLHVGASSPLKLWEPARWMTLATELHARGLQVVWSGGPKEEHLVSAIDPAGRFPSLAGKLDLAQLWHLVAHAELLVCPDTGIAHLGRATFTPTVTLFGPGSASLYGKGRFWRDSPYRAVTIADFPCRDQPLLFKREITWVRRCARTTQQCGDARCMGAISIDMVRNAIDEVIEMRAASSGRAK